MLIFHDQLLMFRIWFVYGKVYFLVLGLVLLVNFVGLLWEIGGCKLQVGFVLLVDVDKLGACLDIINQRFLRVDVLFFLQLRRVAFQGLDRIDDAPREANDADCNGYEEEGKAAQHA